MRLVRINYDQEKSSHSHSLNRCSLCCSPSCSSPAEIVAFKQLPIEAFPDVSDVQVTVISLFSRPGCRRGRESKSPFPLETVLSGMPHCVRLFSHTQFGLSFIMLTFDDGANDYFARQQVLERLKGVDLPSGVAPDLGPLTTPIGEIYRYSLKSETLDAPRIARHSRLDGRTPVEDGAGHRRCR